MKDPLLCGSKINLVQPFIPIFLEWSLISYSLGLHAGFLNTLFPYDSPTKTLYVTCPTYTIQTSKYLFEHKTTRHLITQFSWSYITCYLFSPSNILSLYSPHTVTNQDPSQY